MIMLHKVLNKNIPSEKKIRLVTRPGVLTKKQTEAWIEIVFARAIKKYAFKCGIKEVEEWAQDWLDGKSRTCKAAGKASSVAWTHMLEYRLIGHAAWYVSRAVFAAYQKEPKIWEAFLNIQDADNIVEGRKEKEGRRYIRILKILLNIETKKEPSQ